jgi:hypothetical protein
MRGMRRYVYSGEVGLNTQHGECGSTARIESRRSDNAICTEYKWNIKRLLKNKMS